MIARFANLTSVKLYCMKLANTFSLFYTFINTCCFYPVDLIREGGLKI